MNINKLKTLENQMEYEKNISRRLEKELSLNNLDLARIHLRFYESFAHQYGMRNVKRYCDLKNWYCNRKGNNII